MTFFIKIKVNETIQWVNKTLRRYELSSRFPEYFAIIPSGSPNTMYGIANDFYSYDIWFISFIEFANDYYFSKQFWKLVFENGLSVNPPGSDRGNCFYPKTLTSLNNWIVKNQNIYPTTLRKCLKAENVFANFIEISEIAGNYLPVFDCETIIKEDWLKLIPFKDKLELADYLTILENISEESDNEDDVKKINKKRIGLVYNKLSSDLSKFSLANLEVIREWAVTNLLLSSNESFKKATELVWIKIPDFIFETEELSSLFIPNNCNTDSNFEELMKLFDVQIIDEFQPELSSAIIDDSFTKHLKAITPFFSLITAKKQISSYNDVFENIISKLVGIRFYTCTEISLAFKHKKKTVKGPVVNAYAEKDKLYYKGKWSSPLTLYALIPKLAKLLGVKGLNEELKLILQSSIEEIKEWFGQTGIDYSIIPEDVIEESESIITTIAENGDNHISIQNHDLARLLSDKNITLEQLMHIINNFDATENEDNIAFTSYNHLEQKGKNEENRIARELVYERLTGEGFNFANGSGDNSVVNGVFKDGIEYPLVVKSYRNTSYKFNIRPNEWLQISKPSAMFWIHRGNGRLEVLNLQGLLRANSEFHVQFETSTFSFQGLVKFAEMFRFVKNVHFQLDAPNFSFAQTFKEYKFDQRENGVVEPGGDNQELLH